MTVMHLLGQGHDHDDNMVIMDMDDDAVVVEDPSAQMVSLMEEKPADLPHMCSFCEIGMIQSDTSMAGKPSCLTSILAARQRECCGLNVLLGQMTCLKCKKQAWLGVG